MDPKNADTNATSNALAEAAKEIAAGPKIKAEEILTDPSRAMTELGSWVGKLKDAAIAYAPTLLLAILTLILGWILTKIIVRIIRRGLRRANIDDTLTGFVCNMAYMALMTLVVISFIGKLGVPTTSFVAVIGAAGLAIGFALQGSLGNFAAGVMLIIFRPFNVGDYVEAAGTAGVVEELAVFATTLRTPDNKTITVPNGNITGDNIVNYSRKDTRRVDLTFGIGYEDDIAKAKQVLASLIAADERILKDPEPVIAVSELADSSVNFAVRPWVKTADYWGVFFDLTEKVKLEFDKQNISIPFPQQDVHLHQPTPAA
jgi:small conductance mechanosensitive channel